MTPNLPRRREALISLHRGLIGQSAVFVPNFDLNLPEATMDRRYYVLKASVFALAVVIAIACGAFQASRTTRHPVQDTHYQAAAMMQATIQTTEAKAASAFQRLIDCAQRASL